MGRTSEIIDLVLDDIIAKLEDLKDSSYDMSYISGIDEAIDIVGAHKESIKE